MYVGSPSSSSFVSSWFSDGGGSGTAVGGTTVGSSDIDGVCDGEAVCEGDGDADGDMESDGVDDIE